MGEPKEEEPEPIEVQEAEVKPPAKKKRGRRPAAK